MKTPILLAALLLAVPLTAAAQEVTSYDMAVRAYHAANQINADVWLNNPNEAEAVRHAMIIARNWGIYPGFEPAHIDPNFDPETRTEGEGCFYYYDDEAGEWRERCSNYHTYQCNTGNKIDDMRTLKEGASWYAIFFGSAAWYATAVGQGWATSLFGGLGIYFAINEKFLQYKLEQMEQNRCVLP